MLVKRHSREGLIALLGVVSDPKGHGVSVREADAMLFTFCLNCPDPCGAMDLVTDSPRGTTKSEIVDAALALPPRDVSTWPEAELSMDHPLRHWKLEG